MINHSMRFKLIALAVFLNFILAGARVACANDCDYNKGYLEKYRSICAGLDQCIDEEKYRTLVQKTCGPEGGVDDPTRLSTDPVYEPPRETPKPRVGPLHDYAQEDCANLAQIRDDELAAEWDQAVRMHTALQEAQDLNRQIMKEGVDRLGALDAAASVIIPLKFINDQLQVVAKLTCANLKEVYKSACAINELGSKAGDAVKFYEARRDLREFATTTVRKIAEEQSKKHRIAESIVAIEEYVEENIKTGIMTQEYAETKNHIGGMLKELQRRIAETDRQLKRLKTKKDSVNKLRNWIDAKCAKAPIRLNAPRDNSAPVPLSPKS